MNILFLGFILLVLAIAAVALIRGGAACRSSWLAWCGLAAAMIGGCFFPMQHALLYSRDFLYAFVGLLLAQGFWIAFLRCHAKVNVHVFATLLISLGMLFGVRVIPAMNATLLAAALAFYVLLAIISVSYACGRHHLSPVWGFGLGVLFFSNVMMLFGSVLHVPRMACFADLTYWVGLLIVAVAIAASSRKQKPFLRLRYLQAVSLMMLFGGAVVFILFLAAMWFYPGRCYNPCRSMLSHLGRTHLQGVDFPMCHYFFTFGLIAGAGLVALFFPALRYFLKGSAQKKWLLRGGVLNVAGLLTIAFFPENVHGFFHNVGCNLAVAGGVIAMVVLTPKRNNPSVPGPARWFWLVWSCVLVVVFSVFLILHRFRILPFSPYVPTCQKILIFTFFVWLEYYAVLLFRRIRCLSR